MLTVWSGLAAWARTSKGLGEESQNSALDRLGPPHLSAAELCRGWFIVGTRHRYLEIALLSPILVSLCQSSDWAPTPMLEAWAALLLAPACGARAGLRAPKCGNRAAGKAPSGCV